MSRIKRHNEKGLTLIEVLVAILILGTAAASLLALVTQQTANADAMRENVLARIAAENVMVETVLADARNEFTDSGTIEMAGRLYDWTASRAPSPVEGLETVVVEIRDPERDGRVLASLGTLSPEVGP